MRHFNRYVYAYDNPYKFKDPDGRCPEGSTKRTCIQSNKVHPNKMVQMKLSPAQEAAAKAGKGVVKVSSGDSKEKLGSVNRQANGSLTVEPVANATTGTTSTAYTATGTLPANAEVVIHGHLAESGLKDDKATLGDAKSLVDNGKVNVAVGADGRMAAHEVENGAYQIRAVNGAFTSDEVKHFQGVVDDRQRALNDSNE